MEYFKHKYYPKYNENNLNEFELMKNLSRNNVIRERVELYSDFTLNLLYYLYDTYLGDEYIKTEKDIVGHYEWCFNKVIDEFDDEDIHLSSNDELFHYFFKYYQDFLYKKSEIRPISFHKKFWNEIFEYKKINKTKDSFKALMELYHIFDNFLSKNHE